jgi:lysophospholipase L1-like esterase
VAVPGAKVIDALSNSADASSPNELTTFILGGRTQVEAATEIQPTFASVWLGNNDALGAALAGNTDLLTPTSAFESQITRVIDSLTSAGAEQGVLIGVTNPTYVPNLSPGRAYAAAEPQINQIGNSVAGQSSNLSWGGYSVDANCSGSGAATRIPFSYGIGALFVNALQGNSVQLNCAPSSAPDPLLTPSEQSTISSRVQAYNTILSSLASERGWAYVDVNPALAALYAANANDANPSNDLVPKFPNPPNLQNPAESPPTFGQYFSEDGVHPSSETHRVIAHLVIERLNARYEDVTLDQISIPDEIASLLESS